MGADLSIPDEELQELMKGTSFKRKDLKRWYRKFMKNYPDGKMKMEDFQKVCEKLYPTTTTTATTNEDIQFSQHIFRSFDRHNKGFISFKELMLTFSITWINRNGRSTYSIWPTMVALQWRIFIKSWTVCDRREEVKRLE